jgi:hypothetical protein
MLNIANKFYTLRFLRLLTTAWKDTKAFKAGIIDDEGNVLRKAGPEDKKVYNMFHKLVFNIKRLLNKLPFGRSKLGSYAAALLLLKDHTEIPENVLGELLYELFEFNPLDSETDEVIKESQSFLLNEDLELEPGAYEFCEETLLLRNGDTLDGLGRKLVCTVENNTPTGYIFGLPIFKLTDAKTGATVIASNSQLTPLSQ